MNEDSLLELLRYELPIHDPSVIVGSGDDCAIVKPPKGNQSLVLKTDATVEGIHFNAGADLTQVGWKALCRCISDFAAMGAIPKHALITVAAPAVFQQEKWLQLAHGFGKAARTFGIVVVGGEITRSPGGLFISVTITGSTGKRSSLRSMARKEDLICVTGRLGGSLQSGHHLNFFPRLAEGQWLAGQRGVHAMMDLSDGLGSDLPRLTKASRCSFTLEKNTIPCHDGVTIEEAMSDGEDYELLVTIAPETWPKIDADWKRNFPTLPLTPIGSITSADQYSTELSKGFDHLS
ncbi:MAG: thiamine-phosphate kinase [Verrucomicrobia bacterium]|nr:MAG: thiamine-phosphate kinase [Verrucomicrobiota bacterium]